MKKLAIVLTVLAVLAVGAIFYQNYAATLPVKVVRAASGPAAEREDVYRGIVKAAEDGELSGTAQGLTLPEDPEGISFVSLSLEAGNFGILPVEWFEIEVALGEGDLLQVPGASLDIGPMSRAAVEAALVYRGDNPLTPRALTASYYIWGRKYTAPVAWEVQS